MSLLALIAASPLVFYSLTFLVALIILAIAFPIFSIFIAGTLFKLLFIAGGLIISYIIMKNIMKGRTPVITGTVQILSVMIIGFVMPTLLSKLGLQSIVVPTFAALGGDFIILPFEIPTPTFWIIGLVLFMVFLDSQRKIGRRFHN